MTVTIDAFEVADPADAWTRAGFSIDSDAVCRIGVAEPRRRRHQTPAQASSGGRCAACRRTCRSMTSTVSRRRGRPRPPQRLPHT